MDYLAHYNALILRGQNRVLEGYKERHHIVPKCIGGLDDKNNIVSLTAEEHYVAHQLLVKIYPSVPGLIYATMAMCGTTNKNRNNKSYGWIRKIVGNARKGIKLSEEHRLKVIAPLAKHCRNRLGTKQSTEQVEKHVKRMMGNTINNGRKWDRDIVEKRAKSNSIAQAGVAKTEEHKMALKNAAARPLTYIRRCVSQAMYQARKNNKMFSELI